MNMCRSVAALFRRLSADRRGATAVVFALGATVLFGFIGLATEGGTWYLEKRYGQNAADAGATYGALALASSSTTPDTDAAKWVRSSYNYATSEATVTRGNYAAASNKFTQSASGNAIQALVTRSPSRLFSGLFLSTNPIISETAVAVVNTNNGKACALALSGGLNFTGSTQIQGDSCALASNATGSKAVDFTGNKASVPDGTLVSAGGCTASGNSSCGNLAGSQLYQPPTTDPFTSVQSITMPPVAASRTTCQNMPSLSGTVTLTSANTYEGAGKMFCSNYSYTTGSGPNKTTTTFSGDLTLSSGNTLDLAPGTYIFYDASIAVNGTATLTCTTCTPGGAGVTIILTGDIPRNIGVLSIAGGANVTLNAPATNSFNATFDGVLFYMDKRALDSNGNGNAPVALSGSSTVQLTGGMYFPSVSVTYTGNGQTTSGCTEIIGSTLSFSGNSYLNITGCAADGTNVAQTKSVQLVQ